MKITKAIFQAPERLQFDVAMKHTSCQILGTEKAAEAAAGKKVRLTENRRASAFAVIALVRVRGCESSHGSPSALILPRIASRFTPARTLELFQQRLKFEPRSVC
jgi:hypothetical protein